MTQCVKFVIVVSIIAGVVLLLFSGGQEHFMAWGQVDEPGINLLTITHGGQDDAIPDGEDVDPGAFTVGSPTGDPNTPYDFQPMKLDINVPSDVPECESDGPYPVKLTLPQGVGLLDENGETDKREFAENTTVLVKATQPSTQLRDIEITAECPNCEAIKDDIVKATAVVLDLDIDSDNDERFSVNFGRDNDDIENDATKPGKFLAVNDGDADNDGIPDFADFETSAVYQGNTPVRFTPLVLELPEPLELEKVKIRLTYSASDPNGVAGSGTQADPYAAAPGHLRIWKVDGSVNRNISEVSPGGEGHYVKPDSEYKPSALGPGRTITLFVEGIKESSSIADQQIKVKIDPNGNDEEPEFIGDDVVRVTVLRVDLDIDSDNNNGFDAAWGRTDYDYEDHIENIQEDPSRPGKLIPVNNGDADSNNVANNQYGDGIPDFADFDIVVAPGDTPVRFTPLILELPEPLDLGKVKIQFTYSASDPSGVTGSGTPADPYAAAPGHLRIWKVDGSVSRNVAEVSSPGGHFVKSGSKYGASHLGPGRIITLYVEGIEASATVADQPIKIEIDPNGEDGKPEFICEDIVRITNIDLELPVANTDYPMAMEPPAMPTDIRIRNSDPGLAGTIEYRYVIGDPYTGHILEYEDKPNGYNDPQGTIDSGWIANREWTIPFGNDVLYGGRFTTVKVQIRKDGNLIGNFIFKRHFFIVGDALTRGMLTNYLATIANLHAQDEIMARAIARSETDTTHFWPNIRNNNGYCTSHSRYPNCGESPGGNGYGVFQLTNPVPERHQIWNWQRNTDAALILIAAKRAIAVGRLNAHPPYTNEQLRHETYAAYNAGSYYEWVNNQWVEDPAYTCGCNGPRWGQEVTPPQRCRPLSQCYANFTYGLEY